MNYLIAESEKNALLTWHECKAKTMPSAKGVARRAQVFQGTSVHVGVRMRDGTVCRVASWFPKSDPQAGWNDWDDA